VLGLQLDPEDGGSTLLPNMGVLLPDYTASHSRRYDVLFMRKNIMIRKLQQQYAIWKCWLEQAQDYQIVPLLHDTHYRAI
jgi:hypothetical protein